MPIIVPLIFFIVSLIAISYIIGKKLPILRSLDSSALAGELNLEVKKNILEERLKRRLGGPLAKTFTPLKQTLRKLGSWLKGFYKTILEKERRYRAAATQAAFSRSTVLEKDELVEEHIEEAKTLESLESEDEQTEEKYLEILSLDPKNIEAYEGLARLFFRRKEFTHAREIYEHLLKLGTKKVEHFIELAEVWVEEELYSRAIRVLKQALKTHPRNPKLLDKIIQLAILLKDSGLAKDYLKRLVEINPENKKAAEYRKIIKAL